MDVSKFMAATSLPSARHIRRHTPGVIKVDSGFLKAGLLKAIDFPSMIDRRRPIKSKKALFSHGERLSMIMIQKTVRPGSLLSAYSFWQTRVPLLDQLLGREPEICEEMRQGSAQSLKVCYDLDFTDVAAEMCGSICRLFGIKVSEVVIDTTTVVSFAGTSDKSPDDLEEPSLYYSGECAKVRIVHGKSKDGKGRFPQVTPISAIDPSTGLPVHMHVLSGNTSDVRSFPQALRHAARTASKNGQKLRLVIADAAMCTSKAFEASEEAGVAILTRVHDRCIPASAAIEWAAEHMGEMEEIKVLRSSTGKESTILGMMLPDRELLGHRVTMCVIMNPDSMKSKLSKARRDAEKQLKDLTAGLKKIRCKCGPDAVLAAEKLFAQYPLCRISTGLAEAVSAKTSGRGRAKEESCLFTVEAEAEICPEAVEMQARQECCYCLATNCKDEEWTVRSMHDRYKKCSRIERMHRQLKGGSDCFFDGIYVKRPELAQTLVGLSILCTALCQVLEYVIRTILWRNNLGIVNSRCKVDDKPTWNEISRYLDRIGVTLTDTGGSRDISATPVLPTKIKELQKLPLEARHDPLYIFRKIVDGLGKAWLKLIVGESLRND